MNDQAKISRSSQYWMLILGLFFISISAVPAMHYVQTGTAIIRIQQYSYTGALAAFVITGFLLCGLAIAISALRNILK